MFQDSADITNILSVCLFVCFLFASAGLECVGCSFDFLKVGSVDIYYLANLFPIFDKVMDPKKSAPQCPTASITYLSSMLQVDASDF